MCRRHVGRCAFPTPAVSCALTGPFIRVRVGLCQVPVRNRTVCGLPALSPGYSTCRWRCFLDSPLLCPCTVPHHFLKQGPVSQWSPVVCAVLFLLSELGTAYVSATTGAVATALGLNALTKVRGSLFHGQAP